MPPGQAGDLQAAAGVPAVVHADGLRHSSFDGCEIAHVSGYALPGARLPGQPRRRLPDSRHRRRRRPRQRDGQPHQPAEQTHGTRITDNHPRRWPVHHQAVGVWIGQSFKNRIAHNHIHDLYYTGVSIGWTWGYGKTLARDNVLEYNHIHDLGKGILSDMAGLYTLGMQPGTVVRRQCVPRCQRVVLRRSGASTSTRAALTSSPRTTWSIAPVRGGFHRHYGRDNVVRSNASWRRARDHQLQRTRWRTT
ncbi:MAG: right-handed parallel beta-helix repeat-containing protein [Gemmataceae bacterium]